jgi:hypothetical protein
MRCSQGGSSTAVREFYSVTRPLDLHEQAAKEVTSPGNSHRTYARWAGRERVE